VSTICDFLKDKANGTSKAQQKWNGASINLSFILEKVDINI
jgi:hypothetical protein